MVEKADAQKVCLFAAKVFTKNEPMCKVLEPSVEQFVEQFTPIVELCCASRLSYMIEEGSSILSVSLALPYVDYDRADLGVVVPVFEPILAALSYLSELPSDKEACAYHFIRATDEKHMNKGYAKRVTEGTVQAVAQAGFKYIVADVTNIVSQNLLAYFSYKPFKKLRYHDTECFKAITDTECVIRAIRPIEV
jgi:hypothetical protein